MRENDCGCDGACSVRSTVQKLVCLICNKWIGIDEIRFMVDGVCLDCQRKHGIVDC